MLKKAMLIFVCSCAATCGICIEDGVQLAGSCRGRDCDGDILLAGCPCKGRKGRGSDQGLLSEDKIVKAFACDCDGEELELDIELVTC